MDGVSFQVMPGETLGIVGESGSGKSVTAFSIIKLLQDQSRIAGGSIVFRGRDIVTMSKDEVRSLRGDKIAMVFQDPMTSLNPVLRISDQLARDDGRAWPARSAVGAARARSSCSAAWDRPRRSAPLPDFRINSPAACASASCWRWGSRTSQSLLIADEPTTALDVTIQAQILDLLRELNADFGAAIILISHDLGVIANVCSRVVVMYGGEVVEDGSTEALLSDPKHPYTWALLNAAPRLDRTRPEGISASPPSKGRRPIHWTGRTAAASHRGVRFVSRSAVSTRSCIP